MRRPDDALYLDMLVHARRIAARMVNVSRAQFDADDFLQFGIVYLLQVIGEAATRLSNEQRTTHPEVPWREIIAMRNIIVHDYFRIDRDVVWDTVQKSIPELIKSLEQIVPPRDG